MSDIQTKTSRLSGAARTARWRENNPDSAKASDILQRAKRSDVRKLDAKEWRLKNPVAVKAYAAKYNAENKDKNKRRNRKWRLANPEKVKAIGLKHRSTPSAKIHNAVRAAVHYSLTKGTKAGRKTFDLLNYGVEELRTHLEERFTDGMSWENYGKEGWEIDHIFPLSSFKIETPECPDFRRAWALSNLQPLWGEENRSKNCHFGHPSQGGLSAPA